MATAPAAEALSTAREHHAHNHLEQAAQSYAGALAQDPANPQALLGLSLIARQTRQMQPALTMAQAALSANPRCALAWANCADTLLALGEPSLAKSAYQQSLALDPTLAAAHFGLGSLEALAEQFDVAQSHLRKATAFAPRSADAHFALGFTQTKLGLHSGAIESAIESFARALRLRPGFASAWLNLGVALVADGQDHLAPHCYRQALAASPPDSVTGVGTRISAHINLGHLSRSHRDFPEAQRHYAAALAAAGRALPARLPEIHTAFAYLHLEQHQFPQAWQALRLAERAQNPTTPNPEISNAKGILLLAEQVWEPAVSNPRHRVSASPPALKETRTAESSLINEAIQSFQQAEGEGHKTAPSNRGNALLRLGRVDEALAAHQLAVNRDPHHPGARYNLALTQLRAGNFREGWQNYEARWRFREVHPRPRRFVQPRWLGEILPEGSTLLLFSEQGLGDTLQFVRYVQLVRERTPGSRILLEVQPALMRLLAHSLRGIPHAAVHPHGQPLPCFTHHYPLLSLPALFQTSLETVPGDTPYLAADPQLVAACGRKLASLQDRPGVGLNWAGNPRYRADHERSTTLQTFLPLLELPRLNFISLQHGPASKQIARLAGDLRPLDLSSSDRDLADTAALIHHLDLVITTDTAIAHLAGALGKPLWLLLPWQSDWRWTQSIPTTPWYPTARLFRQSSPNNWPELMDRVAIELRHCQPSR